MHCDVTYGSVVTYGAGSVNGMGILTFALNVTLDDVRDHRAAVADGEMLRYWTRLMDPVGVYPQYQSPTSGRQRIRQRFLFTFGPFKFVTPPIVVGNN